MFYAGYCYIIEDKVMQIWNSITDDELDDIIIGINPVEGKKLILGTPKEKIFLIVGFLYLALNLHTIRDIDLIPSYYLENTFKLNKELIEIKDHLEKQETIGVFQIF